ncbi:hypothetical protein ASG90_01010 [Nocardioides sp. Soil797]|nr:hypothetical protein ASG90_01010 [Nocardioides sp. Soil797]
MALALTAWQSLSMTGVVSPRDVPSFTATMRALASDVQNAELYTSIGHSVSAWLIGIAIVLVVAVPLGLLTALSRPLYEAMLFTVEGVRTIPSIAALPVLVFIYGISPQLTVVLVIFTAVWPLLIQTMAGAHDVDPISIQTAQVYGLSRFQIFRQVTLPSALPYTMTGIKIAANIGLIVAIAASLIVGGEGLGALIVSAAGAGRVDLMYARIVVTGLLGLGVSTLLVLTERRILRWHSSQRIGR